MLLNDIIERKSSFRQTEEHPQIIEAALSFETADQSVFKLLKSVEMKSSPIEPACASNSMSSSRSESRTDSERTSVEFETKNIPKKYEKQNIPNDDGAISGQSCSLMEAQNESDGMTLRLRGIVTSHGNTVKDLGGNNNDDCNNNSDNYNDGKGNNVNNHSNINVIDTSVSRNIREDAAFLRDIERVISAHLHAKDEQNNTQNNAQNYEKSNAKNNVLNNVQNNANDDAHSHSPNSIKHTLVSDILENENNFNDKNIDKAEYCVNIDDDTIKKKDGKEEIEEDDDDLKMLQVLNEEFEKNADSCVRKDSINSYSAILLHDKKYQNENNNSCSAKNLNNSEVGEKKNEKNVDNAIEGENMLDFLKIKINDLPMRDHYCVASNEYNNSESSFLNSLGIIKNIATERKIPEVGLRSTTHDGIDESEKAPVLNENGGIELSNDALTDLETNKNNNEDYFLKYSTPEGVDDAMMVSTSRHVYVMHR